MKPKIFNCRTSKTGSTTPVTVRFTKYSNNNTLAVQLICAKAPWAPYATITVNLGGSGNPFAGMQSDKHAFVDTNNCPWVEDFLKENHIAENTRISMPSGFCMYPLYKFNKETCFEQE